MDNPIEQLEKPKRKQHTNWLQDLMEHKRFLEVAIKEPISLTRAIEAGYTKAEIEKGIALVDKVVAAELDWQNKMGRKTQQYEVFRQGLQNLRQTYIRHLKAARKLFNPETEKGFIHSMQLKGSRPNAVEGILHYIQQFYAVALEEKLIADKFKARNITPEMMEQMKLLAEEVADHREQAQKLRVIAKRATRDRNAALKEFYQWFRPFRTLYQLTPEPPEVEKKVVVKK